MVNKPVHLKLLRRFIDPRIDYSIYRLTSITYLEPHHIVLVSENKNVLKSRLINCFHENSASADEQEEKKYPKQLFLTMKPI